MVHTSVTCTRIEADNADGGVCPTAIDGRFHCTLKHRELPNVQFEKSRRSSCMNCYDFTREIVKNKDKKHNLSYKRAGKFPGASCPHEKWIKQDVGILGSGLS